MPDWIRVHHDDLRIVDGKTPIPYYWSNSDLCLRIPDSNRFDSPTVKLHAYIGNESAEPVSDPNKVRFIVNTSFEDANSIPPDATQAEYPHTGKYSARLNSGSCMTYKLHITRAHRIWFYFYARTSCCSAYVYYYLNGSGIGHAYVRSYWKRFGSDRYLTPGDYEIKFCAQGREVYIDDLQIWDEPQHVSAVFTNERPYYHIVLDEQNIVSADPDVSPFGEVTFSVHYDSPIPPKSVDVYIDDEILLRGSSPEYFRVPVRYGDHNVMVVVHFPSFDVHLVDKVHVPALPHSISISHECNTLCTLSLSGENVSTARWEINGEIYTGTTITVDLPPGVYQANIVVYSDDNLAKQLTYEFNISQPEESGAAETTADNVTPITEEHTEEVSTSEPQQQVEPQQQIVAQPLSVSQPINQYTGAQQEQYTFEIRLEHVIAVIALGVVLLRLAQLLATSI